jgi:hypothetical protein
MPMAELPADLKTCVEDQAKARVEMSIEGYAKFLMPEAVDSLRGSFQGTPPRVGRFEIDSVDEEGSDFWVNVRYFIRDESFIIRSRWTKRDDAWRVVHAERIWSEGEKRPGLVSRWAGKVLGLFFHRGHDH